MFDKKALRKEMGRRRNSMEVEEIRVCQEKNIDHLRKWSLYRETGWVYSYISYKKEFPTHDLIPKLIEDGKRVAAPKVIGDQMKFFEIQSLSDCQPGCMGILEPVNCQKEIEDGELILVPGLAFDLGGGRLGYGGGFYDKYLDRFPNCITAAWIYDLQVIDQVPMEEHDHRIDYLILPKKGIWDCKKGEFIQESL